MKTNRIFLFLLILLTGMALWALRPGFSFSGKEVHLIELNDDTINPITAEYIINSIDLAEKKNAQCLIIKLDTPGGLLNSTRLIVKKILAAKIPIVVYIAPSGSRAGSAGVFITYASHIAAMAPSTNIGAAHPVQMNQKDQNTDFWDGLKEMIQEGRDKKTKEEASGEPELEPQEEIEQENKDVLDQNPMGSKILQDTVAFIKALAKERGRNIEWAIKSVTKSSSITETEAKELNVIEFIAENEQELLALLDGRVVTIQGQEVTLETKHAIIKKYAMDMRQKFFNILANPNVAYILMILGFYGLLYEVTHPGIGVPGVLGAIFLILAFYSMQTLPTNYAGLALIILGIMLFIAEAFIPGIGLPTLGGIVCLFLGSLLLFKTADPVMQISRGLILTFTGLTAIISVLIVGSVIKAHRSKVMTGEDGLIGMIGKARVSFKAREEGKIFVHGEIWNAVCDEDLIKGDKIEVIKIIGLTLTVKKR